MMKHFRLLAEGLDVQPLLAEIDQHPDLWRQITARQDHPESAHKDTECIFLRGPAEMTRHGVQHDLSALDYPALALLRDPAANLVNPLMQSLGITELGRAMIVRLRPGGSITPHADEGDYAAHFARFHFSLQSDEGNLFVCGGEVVHMHPGSAWWFAHRVEHFVVNRSERPRLHLILDAVVPGFDSLL